MFHFDNDTDSTRCITVIINERPVLVPEGISVAAALLGSGIIEFRRSAVDDSPRSPVCLMGVCQECLIAINGQPGQLACQHLVAEGMRVTLGAPV